MAAGTSKRKTSARTAAGSTSRKPRRKGGAVPLAPPGAQTAGLEVPLLRATRAALGVYTQRRR